VVNDPSHSHFNLFCAYLSFFSFFRLFRVLAEEDGMLFYSMSMSMSMSMISYPRPVDTIPMNSISTAEPTTSADGTIPSIPSSGKDDSMIPTTTAAAKTTTTTTETGSSMPLEAKSISLDGAAATGMAFMAIASVGGIFIAALAIRRSRRIKEATSATSATTKDIDSKEDVGTTDDLSVRVLDDPLMASVAPSGDDAMAV